MLTPSPSLALCRHRAPQAAGAAQAPRAAQAGRARQAPGAAPRTGPASPPARAALGREDEPPGRAPALQRGKRGGAPPAPLLHRQITRHPQREGALVAPGHRHRGGGAPGPANPLAQGPSTLQGDAGAGGCQARAVPGHHRGGDLGQDGQQGGPRQPRQGLALTLLHRPLLPLRFQDLHCVPEASQRGGRWRPCRRNPPDAPTCGRRAGDGE